ncbi:MAG: thiamine-phosphate kinase [Gammaproteobacteria bacterium]|nr:thiamine-phosphate kinase [Gammaproteobacteria bacterium]
MNEFELIEQLIQGFGDLTQADFIATGAGDDAAVIDLPEGQQLVVSTDTLVPDVHFPAGARADLVGYRSVAINVSDLAAMGAEPLGITIALTIESLDRSWIQQFAHGIAVASREFKVKVLGGNLARGPLNITMTIHGSVTRGDALLRSTAQIGNDIWLTGILGATRTYLANPTHPQSPIETLLAQRDADAVARYFLPHPRVEFALGIRNIAHGAIDVSDGLASELAHLTKASKCGASICVNQLPVWSGLEPLDAIGPDDSYELLFTADRSDRPAVLESAFTTDTPVVVIGEVVTDRNVIYTLDNKQVSPRTGFDHFA